MKDANATAEATNDAKGTQDAPKSGYGLKVGKPTADWERLYIVLGQFNANVILRANENPECIPDIIDEILMCSLEDPCKGLGPEYVWDVRSQQCVIR